MNVEFTTQKGGSGVSDMGGEVITLLSIDNATIGPSTPRLIVAGEGQLDPLCERYPYGDVDGNCVVDLADVRALQDILVGAREADDVALQNLAVDSQSALDASYLIRVYRQLLN